jgi:hypothetical protein
MLTLTRPRDVLPGALTYLPPSASGQPPAAAVERFGRLFSRRPFAEPTSEIQAALLDLGRAGGPLDARHDATAGRGNGAQPAGAAFAYLFLGHDLTRGTAPAFDLSALYAGGPRQSPERYDPVDRGKLCVESADQHPSTLVDAGVSVLHAALALAHNHTLDLMRARRGRSRGGEDVFGAAQRVLRWHYQWLIVHELLPQLVGQHLVDRVLAHGRRLFVPERACIPVEFQAIFKGIALSMLRDGRIGPGFVTLVFDDSAPNLLQRLLVRHVTWALPSGQAIARLLRVSPLTIDALARYDLGLDESTPLLCYVLEEAKLLEDGNRLGPVGGRIVAEVVLGLLQLDPTSYLSARPDWRPTLSSRTGRSEFDVVDLLAFAGLEPANRER